MTMACLAPGRWHFLVSTCAFCPLVCSFQCFVPELETVPGGGEGSREREDEHSALGESPERRRGSQMAFQWDTG